MDNVTCNAQAWTTYTRGIVFQRKEASIFFWQTKLVSKREVVLGKRLPSFLTFCFSCIDTKLLCLGNVERK